MNFELVFIRHGESESNITKTMGNKEADFLMGITAKGREEAKATKQAIKNESFDTIFSSDMIRTKETAEIIFGDTHKILFDERLREAYISIDKDVVFDYGNTPKDERVEMRLVGFTSGEAFESQVKRIKSFMDMIMTGKYGKKIAIVTHNGCLRALECIFNNVSLKDALYLKRADNGGVRRLFITKNGNQIQASFSS